MPVPTEKLGSTLPLALSRTTAAAGAVLNESKKPATSIFPSGCTA